MKVVSKLLCVSALFPALAFAATTEGAADPAGAAPSNHTTKAVNKSAVGPQPVLTFDRATAFTSRQVQGSNSGAAKTSPVVQVNGGSGAPTTVVTQPVVTTPVTVPTTTTTPVATTTTTQPPAAQPTFLGGHSTLTAGEAANLERMVEQGQQLAPAAQRELDLYRQEAYCAVHGCSGPADGGGGGGM